MKRKDDTVGPWAREKLDTLQRYLNYYTTALKNQPWWSLIYVDAFAGPGTARLRPSNQAPDSMPLFGDAAPPTLSADRISAAGPAWGSQRRWRK
jgi:three-Cys-motif partner protein